MLASLLKKYQKESANFLFIGIIRFFNIVVKFLLVSYLVRTLGSTSFGLLTWTESILQYCVVFVNFGFNIFGARLIIENKENQNKTISIIYSIKVLLLLISFLIILVLNINNSLSINYQILWILYCSVLGDILFPIWYFQAVNNLKPLSICVSISKVILIILTFLFVSNSTHLITYTYIFTSCQILMGILGFITLKKEVDFSFVKFTINELIKTIKKGFLYFLGNISMLVFNALTIFVIGYYLSKDLVTAFDISLKVVMLFVLPFEILQAAAMPSIAENRDRKKLLQLTLFSLVLGGFMFVILFFFGKYFLILFSGKFSLAYVPYLKKLAFLVFVVPCSQILGNCGLVGFGEDKKFNFSLILISILYCFTIFILQKTKNLNFNTIIALRVIADYVLLIMFLYQIYRSAIFKNNHSL